jgi:hypothetical protein
MTHHTLGVNITILSEVVSGVLLLHAIVYLLANRLRIDGINH